MISPVSVVQDIRLELICIFLNKEQSGEYLALIKHVNLFGSTRAPIFCAILDSI